MLTFPEPFTETGEANDNLADFHGANPRIKTLDVPDEVLRKTDRMYADSVNGSIILYSDDNPKSLCVYYYTDVEPIAI